MKKILFLTILILSSCVAKQKTLEQTKTNEFNSEKRTENVQKEEGHTSQKEVKDDIIISASTKKEEEETNITAEVEPDKPFEIFKTENGRITETFRVTGTAKVEIKKTSGKTTSGSSTATTTKENTNAVHHLKQNTDSVSETQLITEKQTKTKDKKEIDFSLFFWVLAIILGVEIVFFIYLRKQIKNL